MKRIRIAAFIVIGVVMFVASAVEAATFTVNSTGDESDAKPGSGICGTLLGVNKTDPDRGPCTLRAAIEEANAFAGTDIIQFNIPASDPNCSNGVCTINLTKILPDLSTTMSITGPGASLLIVRRDAGGSYRVFNLTATGSVSFAGITVSNGLGAIINNNAAILNVTDCILSGNSTTAGLGGGIFNNSTGPVNVTGTTISNNSAGRGGGIFNNSTATVTVTNSILSNNLSNGSGSTGGGGIYNNSTGTVNITNCTLSGNRASASGVNSASGGGVYNESGAVNVTNSTIESSIADVPNSTASGGGIGNQAGTVNVTNSTIRSNFVSPASGQVFSVNANGAGISNGPSGTVNVTNSTLSNNGASSIGSGSARGGAIFNQGALNVTNSTLTKNVSSGFLSAMFFCGGIFNASGLAQVKSTIIALNNSIGNPGSDPDVSGTFTSQGFNLIGKKDGSTGFTQPTDQTGTLASPLDPKLATSLGDNGGPTLTIALLPGSPAIDKGTSHCLTCGSTGVLVTDQRGSGFPRTFNDPRIPDASGGDGTDIGAFELQTESPTLANVSTRLRVETGDNVLIGGFIITGTQPKKVIVRAIGPSLGLPGQLANPTLELFSGSTLLGANDDWQNSSPADKQAILDSTIPPSNDLESAIVRTLPANNAAYTAIVRGVSDGTGIGVVEAYDLDRTVDSKLANISTRGFIQTGDNVLFAGTIILGQFPQKVMVRAIGPSLQLAGKLADPTLQLFDGNGMLLEENDNWVDSANKQAIIDTGIPPSDNLESAIVRTLPANGAQYTAIVRGANDTTGIAVVEVYALQ